MHPLISCIPTRLLHSAFLVYWYSIFLQWKKLSVLSGLLYVHLQQIFQSMLDCYIQSAHDVIIPQMLLIWRKKTSRNIYHVYFHIYRTYILSLQYNNFITLYITNKITFLNCKGVIPWQFHAKRLLHMYLFIIKKQHHTEHMQDQRFIQLMWKANVISDLVLVHSINNKQQKCILIML